MGPTQVIAHIHIIQDPESACSRKATSTNTQVMCNTPNYSGPDPSVRMQGTNTSTVVANRSERGTSPVSRFQMGNFGRARGGTVGTTNRQLTWLLNPPVGSPFSSGPAICTPCQGGDILTALLGGHVSVFSWQINQITIPLSTSSEDVVMASTSDLPPVPTPHLRGYPHGWPVTPSE